MLVGLIEILMKEGIIKEKPHHLSMEVLSLIRERNNHFLSSEENSIVGVWSEDKGEYIGTRLTPQKLLEENTEDYEAYYLCYWESFVRNLGLILKKKYEEKMENIGMDIFHNLSAETHQLSKSFLQDYQGIFWKE